MRVEFLSSIESNYTVFQSTLMVVLEVAHDTDSKTRIAGVQAQMKEFVFYFRIVLCELILRHTDMPAAEDQGVTRMTMSTLIGI